MSNQQTFSTKTGLSVLPEIDQQQYPSIYLDALRLRSALQAIQAALDNYTGMATIPSSIRSQLTPLSQDKLANLTKTYVQATENIPAGRMVNFYNNSGTIAARQANASTGKPCHAFTNVAVTSGDWGEFIRMGACTSVSSLTIGSTYYLSNTDGLISLTAGTVSQKIGYAMGTSLLVFNPALV